MSSDNVKSCQWCRSVVYSLLTVAWVGLISWLMWLAAGP